MEGDEGAEEAGRWGEDEAGELGEVEEELGLELELP